MKKKKLLLLSVLTLSLFGCSDTKNSAASKPISEAPISNKNNDSTKTSTKTTDSTSPKDSATSDSAVKPDTEKPSTKDDSTKVDSDKKDSTSASDTGTGSVSSPTASPSESETSDIYSTTKWKKDVVDMMVRYLGGNILPYVELGSKIIPTWDSSNSTLSIMGNITTGMTQNRLDTVKTDYEAAGFTVSVVSSKLTATDTAKGLTVVFYDNSGILELDATYDEPFDPAVASAWPQDIIDDLNLNIGGNHAADIPFVYLGTANPTGEMSTSYKKYTITGGTWNNQITTLAETAFNAANASIADDANKWIITTGINSYGTTFNANVTLADGTTMKVSIEAPYSYSYSTTSSKAKMEITFTEAFIVPTNGDWPQDIKDEFNDKADGHVIPYFYLGTLAPTSYYYPSLNELDIKGGTWNDQIYTLCETALNNENATLTDDNLKWKITKNASDLTASRLYADGCSISLKLKKNYSDQPVVEVTYAQGYNAPQGADWTAATKQNFTDHLDGNTVPYVYLGTTAETAAWDDSLSMLTITGDTYFTAVLNGGLSSFQAAGWTAAIKTITEEDSYGDEYSYDIMQAEKVLDATTGSKLTATLTGSSVSSFSGRVSGDCKLSVQYIKPYVAPTGDDAKWDDTTLQFMKDNLQGHTVPYVYLNNTTLKTSGVSGSSATITGGLFSTAMLTAANTAYSTWTNPTIENEKFTASYKEADGCNLTVTLSKTSEGKTQLYITVKASFRADAATDWTDAMKTSMKNCLNGNTIPYIKLGVATPSFTEYKSSNNITIKGNVWDDSILTLAKTDLEAAGWEAFKDDYSTTNYLYAFTKLVTNDYIALKLYKSGSDSYLDVYYYAPSATATKTAWSAAETTFLDSKTQNHSDKVPFFNMGDGDYTTTDATSSAGDKITGTSYDVTSAFEYYKALKAAGYTKFSFNYLYSSSVELKAGYVDPTTGYKIDIKTDYTGYGTSKKRTIEINYTSAFQIPTGDDAKWSDDINSKVQAFIGDNLSVPFVYLGTDTVTTREYTYNSELDLVGGAWDDQVLDLAYTAFSNSTDGWSVVRNNYDSQIMAFLTTPSGHYIKVIVKENYSNKAIIEIYKK